MVGQRKKHRFNGWAWGSEYILSKFISHQMVKGMVSDGLPVTMVMPGLPFGPGDRAPTPTGTMILRTLKGQMKNYWDGGVCAVDVRDVAAGHVLAMEKGRIGQSYALTNKDGNMTNKEVLTLIGNIAGVANVAKNEVAGKTMLRVARLVEALSKVDGQSTHDHLQKYLLRPAAWLRGSVQGHRGIGAAPDAHRNRSGGFGEVVPRQRLRLTVVRRGIISTEGFGGQYE